MTGRYQGKPFTSHYRYIDIYVRRDDVWKAEVASPPEDWLAFANAVYEFCPDVVDQGANDVATLAAEMRRSNALFLWWD